MSGEPLVLATRSLGKAREVKDLFRTSGYRIVTLAELGVPATADEHLVESADTFQANAVAKAHFFAEQLNRPVLADDSGLEVLALDGRPGVFSKRWSGRPDLVGEELDDANNAKLLASLRGVRDRRARYVCAAAFSGTPGEIVVLGTTEGTILEAPQGFGGFGYDPYFFSCELGKSFGEASLKEKQSVSHRARAFRALLVELRRLMSQVIG